MLLKHLTVGGLRGISTDQSIQFAQPDGNPGSGLTVLVGPNNAGKSTFIEAMRYVSSDQTATFSEGKRNRRYGDLVKISLANSDGGVRTIESLGASGSETRFGQSPAPVDVFVVPSRRGFAAYFSDAGWSRKQYSSGLGVPAQRSPILDNFPSRLFALAKDSSKKANFNKNLRRILGRIPEWTIDQSDSGQHYLKFMWTADDGQTMTHSSDGLGEGLVSLFVVLDSLIDSETGSMIVIDEPELSLHPQYQKRLRRLISDFSKDRQVVCATHSPYFIDWGDVTAGATISRIHKTSKGTSVSTPTRETLNDFANLGLKNLNNPHVLGLQANEVFFLEGGIVLVEGQDDVITFPRIAAELGFDFPWSFFGWGIGGGQNMSKVCRLLNELGYDSVAGILDSDMATLLPRLQEEFPDFMFASIAATDIREKKPRPATLGKAGLVDSTLTLRPEHVEHTTELLNKVNAYFDSDGVKEIL